MAQPSRRRARAEAARHATRDRDPGPNGAAEGGPGPTRPVASRSELRNAAARAALEPLARGERPGAVTVAALTAAALGLANVIAYLAGTEIQGKPAGPGVLTFSAVMAIAAAGMWRARYWAVLGFQALLALIVLAFGLFLVRASNVEAVLVCVVVMGLAGWLFYKLVRALARIQMPVRRPEQ